MNLACRQCGRVLPQTQTVSLGESLGRVNLTDLSLTSFAPGQVFVPLAETESALDRWEAGQLTDSQLEAALVGALAKLDSVIEALATLPPHQRARAERAFALAEESHQLFGSGIEAVFSALEADDAEELDQALERCHQAARDFEKAVRVGEEELASEGS